MLSSHRNGAQLVMFQIATLDIIGTGCLHRGRTLIQSLSDYFCPSWSIPWLLAISIRTVGFVCGNTTFAPIQPCVLAYTRAAATSSPIVRLVSTAYHIENSQLTHLGRDKMATISQTTFSNSCLWMKMLESRLKFHWNFLHRVQLTIFQYWFRWWLGAVQATSHYLKQRWLVHRRIYASVGLNELSADQSYSLMRAVFSRSDEHGCDEMEHCKPRHLNSSGILRELG